MSLLPPPPQFRHSNEFILECLSCNIERLPCQMKRIYIAFSRGSQAFSSEKEKISTTKSDEKNKEKILIFGIDEENHLYKSINIKK